MCCFAPVIDFDNTDTAWRKYDARTKEVSLSIQLVQTRVRATCTTCLHNELSFSNYCWYLPLQ